METKQMKAIKTILAVCLLSMATAANAQKTYLHITKADGTKYEFASNEISTLTMDTKAATTASAKAKLDGKNEVDVMWVQLWADGPKWATINVGGNNCYDYGDYFAWGETMGRNSGKTSFSWSTYKWMAEGKSSWDYVTKYTLKDGQTDGQGGYPYWYDDEGKYVGTTIDGINYKNLTELQATDDAATANWGSNWRTPTPSELLYLCSTGICSWTWYDSNNSEFNGVAGYKVQGKTEGYTDNYIFLPSAGSYENSTLKPSGNAGYWSSSLSEESESAQEMFFNSVKHGTSDEDRCCGLSVRPVLK